MSKLSLKNYGKPESPLVKINPRKASKTIAQAWEHNSNWYYNWKGAMIESAHRGEGLPTKDELLAEINSIPGDCIKKIAGMKSHFLGYRNAGTGEIIGGDKVAYFWSSSEHGSNGGQFVFLHNESKYPADLCFPYEHGLSVRSIK